jgi:hypothetical protein
VARRQADERSASYGASAWTTEATRHYSDHAASERSTGPAMPPACSTTFRSRINAAYPGATRQGARLAFRTPPAPPPTTRPPRGTSRRWKPTSGHRQPFTACHSDSTRPLGIARGVARITVRWQSWSPWPGPVLPESGQARTQGGWLVTPACVR